MALTPEDVVNKRFQPTKFREGYDQDEVDDFLDEVVVELRRLNQDNEELRQRVIAGESRISELQRGGGAAAASVGAESAAAASETPSAAPIAPVPAAAPIGVPVVAETPAAPAYSEENDPNNTNNLLQLARRLHEEHVREGIEKRDALIAEGHATAARLVSEAETEQRVQLSTLDEEKTTLENRIDELRTFEREYRAKLKGHIEGLLHDLDAPATSSGPPAQSGQAAQSGQSEQGDHSVESGQPAAQDASVSDSAPDAEAQQPDGVSFDSVPAAPAPSTGFQGFGGH